MLLFLPLKSVDPAQILAGLKKGSFAWAQARIEIITEKAAVNEHGGRISAAEKAFLWTLYHAIGAAGRAKGMPEASKLIWTYVRIIPPLIGKQNAIDIGSEIYETSPTVQREMSRQIDKARSQLNGKPEGFTFSQSSSKLMAEQSNLRMKYADNRFIMTSTSVVGSGVNRIVFRVDNRYDFERFASGKHWRANSKYTIFPYQDQQLKIYDGLSWYLTQIGLAEEFDYYAEWTREFK